jgi:hypothetical protein
VRLYVVIDNVSESAVDRSPASDENVGVLVYDTTVTMSSITGGMTATNRKPPHVLDERGAASGCSSLIRDTKELLIGREEGVFSFSVDDRGGAAGLEGNKQATAAVGR